jgi:hypothetical protein
LRGSGSHPGWNHAGKSQSSFFYGRRFPAQLSRAPLVGQQIQYLLSLAQFSQPVGDHRLDRAGGGGHVPDRIIAGLRDQSALVQPARALPMSPADSPVADLICAQVADTVVATKQ